MSTCPKPSKEVVTKIETIQSSLRKRGLLFESNLSYSILENIWNIMEQVKVNPDMVRIS